MGLMTYRINRKRTVSRLKALFKLARLLNWSELVINIFEQTNRGVASDNLFSVNESDIDRKFDSAPIKLGDEAVAVKYLRGYGDADLSVAKMEVIFFAENNACAEALQKNGYIADIPEPHDSTRRDSIGKARASAEYAKENSFVGRLELIRREKNCFKRLDMAQSDIREKILRALTNAELDNLFDEHGKI